MYTTISGLPTETILRWNGSREEFLRHVRHLISFGETPIVSLLDELFRKLSPLIGERAARDLILDHIHKWAYVDHQQFHQAAHHAQSARKPG